MRLGNTLKASRPYSLPARDTMDVVGSSDLSSLLTTVRGVNPFDVSPGIQLIVEKMETRPKSANPYVQYTNTLDMDREAISTVVDSQRNTALHVAAGCGHAQTLQALLDECGASADPVNADGFTPLHLAAMGGHLECVHRLISAGANPQLLVQYDGDSHALPFLRGRTALFLAHWYQHTAVEALLKSFGVGTTYAGRVEELRDFWKNAAAGDDVVAFAHLFDVLDCHGNNAVCPLEVPCLTAVLPDLVENLPDVLSHVLPPHVRMSPSQNFIFEGLVARGLVGANSLVAASTDSTVTVLDRVLVAGHMRAFRGLNVDVPSCDPPLSLRVHSHTDDKESQLLLLLIKEAEARASSIKAVAAYQKRPNSRRLKSAALAARQAWMDVRQAVEAQGALPLS